MERTVQILGQPLHVTTSHHARSEWRAVGTVAGERLETTAESEGAALKAWREAATLKRRGATI